MARPFYVASFAEVEVDMETGKYHIRRLTDLRRVGTSNAPLEPWAGRCWDV